MASHSTTSGVISYDIDHHRHHQALKLPGTAMAAHAAGLTAAAFIVANDKGMPPPPYFRQSYAA